MDTYVELKREAIAATIQQIPISIIVPTYKEGENIPHLIEAIDALRQRNELTLELIIVDDNSDDGTRDHVEQCGLGWVSLIVRPNDHGLATAVLLGIERAVYSTLVVMDADLSHPPDAIPRLVYDLTAGKEMAVGSRYVDGGSTDSAWSPMRWLPPAGEAAGSEDQGPP